MSIQQANSIAQQAMAHTVPGVPAQPFMTAQPVMSALGWNGQTIPAASSTSWSGYPPQPSYWAPGWPLPPLPSPYHNNIIASSLINTTVPKMTPAPVGPSCTSGPTNYGGFVGVNAQSGAQNLTYHTVYDNLIRQGLTSPGGAPNRMQMVSGFSSKKVF